MAAKTVVYRSSKTGKFVKEKFAEQHKATTEKQHVNVMTNEKGK